VAKLVCNITLKLRILLLLLLLLLLYYLLLQAIIILKTGRLEPTYTAIFSVGWPEKLKGSWRTAQPTSAFSVFTICNVRLNK